MPDFPPKPVRTSTEASVPASDLQALDHPLVLPFIFHPRADTRPVPDDPHVEEQLFPVEEGVDIGCRFYISGERDPLILYFHGNGEIASDYDEIAVLYNRLGINLLVFDYRGYGKSKGHPTLSAMMRDAGTLFETAYTLFVSRGFVGDVWVMGRSLGSASALEVARSFESSLKGLIVESGFADTHGLLKRLGAPVQRLSISPDSSSFNLVAIRTVRVPTLIIHGAWDQIIPLEDGQALFEASAASQKELVVIPKAGHNDLMWMGLERYMDAISRFTKGDEKTARP